MTEEKRNVSRRGFVRAAGVSMLGAAAAAGAFGLSGCSSALEATETSKVGGGVATFLEGVYTDVFPVPTRAIPVIDAPSDIVRQGQVAFEDRTFLPGEIKRIEETDVLVCGCGITGSVAALSASDDGKTKVMCLEKMSNGRGRFEGMGVTGGK